MLVSMTGIEKLKELNIEDIQADFKVYLENNYSNKSTINTAYSDAFYIWKNRDKDIFWNVIESDDFEKVAKETLNSCLLENSSGEVEKNINGYMSHLRTFKKYVLNKLSDLENNTVLSKDEKKENELKNHKKKYYSLNTILYGPPGTGKTYNSIYYAVGIIEGKPISEISKEPYDDVLERYNRLKVDGRIAFTTFHQSYGYEEFIEGIRPIENSDNKEISYSVVSGIFKSFCERASEQKIADCDGYLINEKPQIWGVKRYSVGRFFSIDIKDVMEEGSISIKWTKEKNVDQSTIETIEEQIRLFEQSISEGDIVVAFDEVGIIEAVGVYSEITYKQDEVGNYEISSEIHWLVYGDNIDQKSLNSINISVPSDVVFNCNSIGLKTISELVKNEYELNIVECDEPYVMIIDEINRGNISKILGELITLLEPSKRKGNPNQLSAILPYSKEEFFVPNNVYIIGTMNTSDRSIALMDTALRRRFKYVEMMPKCNLLKGVKVEGIEIDSMLDKMNKRIELLYDREHMIGHSYFMRLKEKGSNLKDLSDIFLNEIIPLLQEYFFDDYEKIILVLADNQKAQNERFISKEDVDTDDLFGETDDKVISEKRFVINENIIKTNVMAYKKIYSKG